MTAFWQGLLCLYFGMGGILLIWAVPDAWTWYHRKHPGGSRAIFIAIVFLFWLFWIVPLLTALRRAR